MSIRALDSWVTKHLLPGPIQQHCSPRTAKPFDLNLLLNIIRIKRTYGQITPPQ